MPQRGNDCSYADPENGIAEEPADDSPAPAPCALVNARARHYRTSHGHRHQYCWIAEQPRSRDTRPRQTI